MSLYGLQVVEHPSMVGWTAVAVLLVLTAANADNATEAAAQPWQGPCARIVSCPA